MNIKTSYENLKALLDQVSAELFQCQRELAFYKSLVLKTKDELLKQPEKNKETGKQIIN